MRRRGGQAGCRERVGHRVQRPGPEAHQGGVAAHGPLFGSVADREVVGLAPGLALPEIDRVRVVDGHDQPSAGLQHAPQLGQRFRPVLQVVQHQSGDDIVEHTVTERQRVTQVGEAKVRVRAEPPPGQLQHPSAGVKASNDRAPVTQHRGQGARAAADVEDPPSGHVPGQVQDRGPHVVAVDEVGLGLGRVRLGEAVIVVGTGHGPGCADGPIASTRGDDSGREGSRERDPERGTSPGGTRGRHFTAAHGPDIRLLPWRQESLRR